MQVKVSQLIANGKVKGELEMIIKNHMHILKEK